jgi:hypothetical protein
MIAPPRMRAPRVCLGVFCTLGANHLLGLMAKRPKTKDECLGHLSFVLRHSSLKRQCLTFKYVEGQCWENSEHTLPRFPSRCG